MHEGSHVYGRMGGRDDGCSSEATPGPRLARFGG